MRWLIVNTDYDSFLDGLYTRNIGLENAPYAKQMQARMESLFGVADFYSNSLRALGEDAQDILVNNSRAQHAWARENGVELPTRKWIFGREPRGSWNAPRAKWGRAPAILDAQIKKLRPDVIVNMAMDDISPAFFREAKPSGCVLMGQHAAMPLSNDEDWSVYDICVSSFPPTVDWMRSRGLKAELCRLAFEPRVLDRVNPRERDVPVSFVGSFGMNVHSGRVKFLCDLARHVPLQIWGSAPAGFFDKTNLKDCYRGPAFGLDMYEVLARSKITVNHHGDVPAFANNFRLFEATGMGAALVTDAKPNLREMFNPEGEVIAYQDVADAVSKIKYFLDHDDERAALAAAGQARTLRDHTFAQRAREMIDIVTNLLSDRSR